MITPVTKDNVQAWAALCEALWPEPTPDEAAADFIQEWEAGELPHEFLYYIEGTPVAFMSLNLRHDYVEGTETSPVGYLEGIYVAPAHRKSGIARRLIDFAKEWTQNKGCTELASDVELPNEASISFHKRMGFAEANRVVCFAMKV
ncbi:MAG: GNAT family N-acetyltransferase [Defluviitaleaceae bacterium]|nr:GNAT family N-acetyltransferase [Defluviitaleaceae bacterium]